jgi:hypothetical protein
VGFEVLAAVAQVLVVALVDFLLDGLDGTVGECLVFEHCLAVSAVRDAM